ncbi:MAG: helix-turn-helix domain-containing protein [Spirochaetaceae bacterium]|jgi:AraC-like DNA-binding protein/ligand-binding sensor protein|nr:helix-turn-helix domain-containing protein [Spirochaetaceae bacterium]
MISKNDTSNTNYAPPSGAVKKTRPLLFKAWQVACAYAKATGTIVSVVDENYLNIQEILPFDEKITCLYCIQHQSSARECRIEELQDLTVSPCNMMHLNAIKKAQCFDGSYIYMCALGFMFWTSPIFSNGRFAGALIASGFLGIDSEETTEAMYAMGNGAVSGEELRQRLAKFPHGEAEKIKALAELLQTCAESLSVGNEGFHAVLKRRTQQQSIISEQISLLKNQHPEDRPAPGYPIEKERMLLSALHRGDYETGKKALNELLSVLFFSNPGHFNYIRFRAIELVVLLSRSVAASGNTEYSILETNNGFLKRIQDVQNIEELTDVLHTIVETMSKQIFSFRGIRHAAALRKAERFIYENYNRKISLKEIASASGLSAPYFSTIFKEEMGENLSTYLSRLRVEKAYHLLTETTMTLSEIAESCGFEDQSWFSKIFKKISGTSPGKYRTQGGVRLSEISEPTISEH